MNLCCLNSILCSHLKDKNHFMANLQILCYTEKIETLYLKIHMPSLSEAVAIKSQASLERDWNKKQERVKKTRKILIVWKTLIFKYLIMFLKRISILQSFNLKFIRELIANFLPFHLVNERVNWDAMRRNIRIDSFLFV